MFIFRIVLWVIFGLVVSCGLTDPKFENYEEEGSNTGGGDTIVDASTECGKTALASFNSNISPAIGSKCATAGCHASGAGAAKMLLTSGQDESNRSNLFGYTGFDSTKLTGLFTGGSHTGGDLTSNLPEAKVSAWLDVEQKCVDDQAQSS